MLKSHFSLNLIVIFTATIFFTGCAQIKPIPTSLANSIKIVDVKVRYTKNHVINWWKAEDEYMKQANLKLDETAENYDDLYQDAKRTPEAKAFVRNKLAGVIKSELNRLVVPRYENGTQDVILDVEVRGLDIPSPVRRVLIGGSPLLEAVTYIRDAKTGRELAKHNRLTAAYAGSGWGGVLIDQAFEDLDKRVISSYGEQIANWLSGEENQS